MLCLLVKSLSHSGFTFVYDMRKYFHFIDLHEASASILIFKNSTLNSLSFRTKVSYCMLFNEWLISINSYYEMSINRP